MSNIKQSSAMQCVCCIAVFKDTGQRCAALALVGKRTCARHGALSTGPRTAEGKKKCSAARTVHGRDTIAFRKERSLASARLAVLETVGFGLGLMIGTRTRGRRPDRIAEAYPELQALYQKLAVERAKHSA